MWQLNLNLMGVIRMTKAVLPSMRARREGHIINISSVGGLVGQPFNEIYCATNSVSKVILKHSQAMYNLSSTLNFQ